MERKRKIGAESLLFAKDATELELLFLVHVIQNVNLLKKDEAEEARKKNGCNLSFLQKGDISERRGRFGIFYSCSNYPDCKYAIKAKPTGKICNKWQFFNDGKGQKL